MFGRFKYVKRTIALLMTMVMLLFMSINAYANTEGMSEEKQIRADDFLDYYDEYAESHDNPTTKGFIQYAVDRGLIEDTPMARDTATIESYRSQFLLAVAVGRAAGLNTASDFLEHSLQDNPSDMNHGSSSTYATQILNSTEMGDIRTAFSAAVSGKNLTYHQISGSTTLNSTTDLHLAYNQVSYVAYGTRTISGLWNLTITITDRYDFQQQPWANQMTTADLVTFINNEAAAAQDAGAIVPYNIRVTVSTQCREVIIENMSVDQWNLVD